MKDLLFFRYLMWVSIVFLYILTIFIVYITEFNIDYMSFAPVAFVSMVLLPVFGLYCYFRNMLGLQLLVEVLCGGLLITIPVVIATYLAIQVRMPLADPLLMAWDNQLGFPWSELVSFVDQKPWLSRLLWEAYQTFPFQLLGVPALLCCIRSHVRAYQFVTIYALICFVSSVISIWFPALGAFASHDVSQAD